MSKARKLIAFALVFAMALAFSATAFADDEGWDKEPQLAKLNIKFGRTDGLDAKAEISMQYIELASSRVDAGKALGYGVVNAYHEHHAFLYENRYFESKGDYDTAMWLYKDWVRLLDTYSDVVDSPDHRTEAAARIYKLDPLTNVYALTSDTSKSPYFGAKYEPKAGTYTGLVPDGFLKGGFGGGNTNDIVNNEAMTTIYVEVTGNANDFSYMLEKFDDGKHAIQVAYNYTDTAQTAQDIIDGKYDTSIDNVLRFCSSIKGPVFLRIGAEQNNWGMDPEVYKQSYIYIAKKARASAPNAALVFSLSTPQYGQDITSYYPGDNYVDWVGMSLYTGAHQAPDNPAQCQGRFSDTLLIMYEIARAFPNKPLMVSEGGIQNKFGAEAVRQVTKMYEMLNMVFPQVKAIIYFDTEYLNENFRLDTVPAIKNAYTTANANNKTLLHKYGEAASLVYTKLDEYRDKRDTLDLAAYSDTVFSDYMTVTYTLDGTAIKTSDVAPFYCSVKTADLSVGNHKLVVSFNDGAGYAKDLEYSIAKSSDGTVFYGTTTDKKPVEEEKPTEPEKPDIPDVPDTGTVTFSTQTVSIDGKPVGLPTASVHLAYGDVNYVYVRDLAMLLTDTPAKFDVGWDGVVNLLKGKSYTVKGVEFVEHFTEETPYTKPTEATKLDGTETGFKAIQLKDAKGGYTYYQLRDLGYNIGFNVGWTNDRGMFIETDKPYDPAN